MKHELWSMKAVMLPLGLREHCMQQTVLAKSRQVPKDAALLPCWLFLFLRGEREPITQNPVTRTPDQQAKAMLLLHPISLPRWWVS